VRQAVLVCSKDGLDEVSLAAPTMVRVVRGNEYEPREWTPADFGLAAVSAWEIQAKDSAESAATIRAVLNGEGGPAHRIVVANAAAALWTAEAVPTLKEGVAKAEAALKSGTPRAALDALRRKEG
jgi:anthranilate phosphoribosyltransferase